MVEPIIPHHNIEQKDNNAIEAYGISEWMKKKEKSYFETHKVIKEVCKKYNMSSSNNINIRPLMMDTYYKWGYCPNAKVGTSTWRDHFAKLMMTKDRPNSYSGTFEAPHKRTILGSYFRIPRQLTQQLDESKTITSKAFANFLEQHHILTFSFVRHPFERIVSAYKDKVLNEKRFHRGSFSEFIDEFVLTKDNIHWRPFQSRCNFCAISYHVIGRMENFNDDVKYIILKNNLTKVLPIEATMDHKANFSEEKNNKEKEEESLRYFSKLSKTQIQQLYEKYRIDFEMLSFDAMEYLQLQ